MKKILFATSAIVAAGLFTGTAQAAEPIKLSVGGYMEHWYGFVSNDSTVVDRDIAENGGDGNGVSDNANGGSVHASQDVEIHFKGSTTLDNGIKVSAQVELEGNTAGDQIDEMYMKLSGGFGEVILGNDDSAADKLHVSPPSSGFLGYDDSDIDDDWITVPSANNANPDTMISAVSDARKITYFTPSFGGIQAGVSFTPQDGFEDGNGAGNQNANAHNGVSVALGYEGEFSGVSLAASLGYERLEIQNDARATADEDDEHTFWAAGLNVGFGNFTLGGAYLEGDEGDDAGDEELTNYSVGVGYSMGDASVSFGYATSTFTDETSANAVKDEDEADFWEVGASYKVGPGITWQSSLMYASYDGDERDTANTTLTPGSETGEYWVVGTGFKLSF